MGKIDNEENILNDHFIILSNLFEDLIKENELLEKKLKYSARRNYG